MAKQGTNVLIVDDLSENLHALNEIIHSDELTVHQALSGHAALGFLLDHDFALAIIDVQMPGIDGFELAEIMRSTAKTRRIPIIFVSAAGESLNYVFKGYEAGAVDFLRKPLDIAAVRSKVGVFVELYKQRREIQQQMAALERKHQEQEQLVEELHTTQEELQISLRMRDDFMSMVAHELRTPLNALSLESQLRDMQLQKENYSAFGPEQLKKMVARDNRQIQSMVRLIDDMLDVSRLRRDMLSLQPAQFELSGLVQRVVDDLSHQAKAVGSVITVICEKQVSGCWDEFRIEQILINLLSNALRYGSGQPIEVRLTERDSIARIAVSDQGIGISADDQERIFDSFERCENNGVAAGLGLGLHISKGLAEAHFGSISVRSKLGEGSVFTLELPLQKSARL